MQLTDIQKLCVPALINLVLSVMYIISLVTVEDVRIIRFLGEVSIAVISTWLLHYLCKSGYTWVSWFFVLMPFVLFALLIVFAKDKLFQYSAFNVLQQNSMNFSNF